MAGGEGVDADDVDVVVDRLLGDLLRGGEQRADVDVEAEVGEGRDDDLLPAVVAVLAHLRHEDPGTAPLVLLEPGGGLEDRGDGVVGLAHLGPVHAGDRTDDGPVPAPHLLERLRHLADRGTRPGRLDRPGQQVRLR